MNAPAMPLILKVLSGSQFGVEVSLADGEYSFGRGADCDIQFSDVAMAPHHGSLRIAGGKPEVRAAGAALRTASGLEIEPGGADWREIAHLDQVIAGTSVFAVGSPDADWSKLTRVTSSDGPSRAPAPKGSGALPTILSALAVIGVCVVGIVLLTGQGATLPLVTRASPQDDLRNVETAIDGLPFDARLSVDLLADGVVSVEGYVETGAERRAVQTAILETGAPIRRRIWALEALETDARGLIDSRNIDVDHRLRDDGVLVLSGTWLDGAAVDELVQLLESEVFGLAAVEDAVLSARDYLAEVEVLIDRLQLSELVLARLDGPLIETTGVVPSERTDNWVGFMRAYARQYADIIPLRSFVTLEGTGGGGTARPVFLGGQGDGPGRVLSTAEFDDEGNADPSALFADTEDEPGDTAPAAPFETALAGLVGGDGFDTAIDRFVQTNPQVVAGLLSTLTNGQVDSIEGLRAAFAPPDPQDGAAPTDEAPPQDDAGEGGASGRSPSVPGIVALLNDPARAGVGPDAGAAGGQGRAAGADVTPAAPGGVSADTAARAPDSDPERDGDETGDAGRGGDADRPPQDGTGPRTPEAPAFDAAGFLPVPSAFRPDAAFERLARATGRLFDLSDPAAPRPFPDALARFPQLGEVAPELVALAGLQGMALSFGETLIAPPDPLSALPDFGTAGRTCWRGSSLTVESLPGVLLWMDILSLSGAVDLMTLEEGSRRLFIEAALSPQRISRCVEGMNTAFSRQLLRASVFLRENARNDTFAGFLLRNVPRYELDIVGAHLADERYVQLADARKLREGAAPDIARRVTVIGDLGLLVRTADGLEVALFDESVSWSVVETAASAR